MLQCLLRRNISIHLNASCPEGNFEFARVLNGADERCAKDPFDLDREMIKSADVVVGNIPVDILPECTRLKLLQLNMAGSDAYAGKLPAGAELANASGAYGLAISEHMLGMLLVLMKKLDIYRDNQNKGLWRDEGNVESIENAKVLVVGLAISEENLHCAAKNSVRTASEYAAAKLQNRIL